MEQIEIRHMTAKEEDILTNSNYIENGVVFDKFLKSIIVDKRINPDELLTGDKNALLVKSRITGYGPEYVVKDICGSCKKLAEFTYDLNKIKINDDYQLPEDVTWNESLGSYDFVLPRSEVSVGIRLLTGIDEKYIEQQNNKAEELGIENSPTVNTLRRMMVHINGHTDQTAINGLAE